MPPLLSFSEQGEFTTQPIVCTPEEMSGFPPPLTSVVLFQTVPPSYRHTPWVVVFTVSAIAVAVTHRYRCCLLLL